jgi:hypothetical protein
MAWLIGGWLVVKEGPPAYRRMTANTIRLICENLRENQTAAKGGKWRILVVSNGRSEIH